MWIGQLFPKVGFNGMSETCNSLNVTDAAGTGEAEDEEEEEPMEDVTRTTQKLTQETDRLTPHTIDIIRMRDANIAEYSKVCVTSIFSLSLFVLLMSMYLSVRMTAVAGRSTECTVSSSWSAANHRGLRQNAALLPGWPISSLSCLVTCSCLGLNFRLRRWTGRRTRKCRASSSTTCRFVPLSLLQVRRSRIQSFSSCMNRTLIAVRRLSGGLFGKAQVLLRV